jgi:molybdopterin converting factor small subunit
MNPISVTVTFFGPLGDDVGEKTILFEFSAGSNYGDLLDEIGRRFGDRFHQRIWDAKQNEFKAGILVVGEGRDLESRKIPLVDGETIRIIPVFAGG